MIVTGTATLSLQKHRPKSNLGSETVFIQQLLGSNASSRPPHAAPLGARWLRTLCCGVSGTALGASSDCRLQPKIATAPCERKRAKEEIIWGKWERGLPVDHVAQPQCWSKSWKTFSGWLQCPGGANKRTEKKNNKSIIHAKVESQFYCCQNKIPPGA